MTLYLIQKSKCRVGILKVHTFKSFFVIRPLNIDHNLYIYDFKDPLKNYVFHSLHINLKINYHE